MIRPLPRWLAGGIQTWRRHQWTSSGAISLAVHAVLIAAATFTLGGEERTAGEGDELVFLEGIPVTLVESIPSLPSAAAEGEKDGEEPPEEDAPPDDVDERPVEPDAETTEDRPDPPATGPEPLDGPEPVEPEEAVAPIAAADELPEPDAEPVADDVLPQPRARPPRPTTPQVATVERPAEPERTKPPPPKKASAASDAGVASGGAGGGGQSLGQGDPEASRYRTQVAAKLVANRFYPNGARRDRLEGTTTIAFTIDRRGGAADIRVVASSGSAILDDAARAMVRRAEPFPPPPATLAAPVAIRAPLRFEMPR